MGEKLNLREEQVQSFKKWKGEYLVKILLMREVLKVYNPENYQEIEIYKTIEALVDEINSFTITKTEVRYGLAVATTKEDLNIQLDSFLNNLEKLIKDLQINGLIYEILTERHEETKKIFQIY